MKKEDIDRDLKNLLEDTDENPTDKRPHIRRELCAAVLHQILN
jgi:hypothetical protein